MSVKKIKTRRKATPRHDRSGRATPQRDRPLKVRTMEGITTIPSNFGAKETMDRLEATIRAQEITVFARIDHTAGAARAGFALRPTELLIFGNPRAGTPLMQASQAIGIDLPLKVLVWQDNAGRTWLSYIEPAWLAKRHGVLEKSERNVGLMAAALSAVSRKAAGAS